MVPASVLKANYSGRLSTLPRRTNDLKSIPAPILEKAQRAFFSPSSAHGAPWLQKQCRGGHYPHYTTPRHSHERRLPALAPCLTKHNEAQASRPTDRAQLVRTNGPSPGLPHEVAQASFISLRHRRAL